jgi:hypothetical protein
MDIADHYLLSEGESMGWFLRNRKSDSPILVILISILAFAFTCPSASAYGQSTGDKWEFTIAPYLFFSGIDGDITVRGRESSVDASFSDIFDALDFGAQLHLEARKDRLGLLGDLTYLKLSGDEDLTRSRAALSADLEIKQWIVEFGGFYRLGEWSAGREARRKLILDVLLGGRYWSLDTELDLRLAVLNQTRSAQFDADEDWIDPFLGARFTADITENLLFNLRGDIGGFDISGCSDFSYNIIALIGWQFRESTTLWLGYRVLYVDYDTGSGGDRFEFDVTMSGPVLGVAFQF